MSTDPSTLRPALLPPIVVLSAAIIFDQLFWEHDLALNLLLFVAMVVSFLLWRFGWKGLSVPARAALLGLVVTAVMSVVHHTPIALVATVLALPLFAALAHEPQLRSLVYAGPWSVSNFLLVPIGLSDQAGGLLRERRATRSGWRWGRAAFVPVLIVIVFFMLYRTGNPRFEHLTAGFLDGLWQVVADLMAELLTARVIFFLYALGVCAGLLYRFAPKAVLQWEQQWTDALLRRRVKRPHWLAPRAMDPLERERRAGIVLLVLANAMLLVVNIIDIGWVWFGFTVPEDFNLKQFVHEGTWTLIASILLSMVVVLHLFRGNQNFYWRNPLLKMLAFVWIVQNLVLGVSVFLRNWHYISFHGLAAKRIGVIVFLALVLVGLITLFLKLRHRRSFFYLLRVNAWALFIAVIMLTTVDWSGFITRVNLKHSNANEIDIDHYLELGDHVLPTLYANLERVEEQMERHSRNRVRWVRHLDPGSFRAQLDARRNRFLERHAARVWQEWNLADDRTYAALVKQGLVDPTTP